MKIKHLFLIAIVIITCVYLYSHTYLIPFKRKATCIGKIVTSERSGQPYYYLIYKMDDGSILSNKVTVGNYFQTKEGDTFLLDDFKIEWK